MINYMVALVMAVFFLFPYTLAVAQEEPEKVEAEQKYWQKPTAEQVFEYVEVMDNFFRTDMQEARNTLDLWMKGQLPSEPEKPIEEADKEHFAAITSFYGGCTSCIWRCCRNWRCTTSWVVRCLQTECSQ